MDPAGLDGLREFLSAAGDAGVLVLLLFLWRLDRRILAIEVVIETLIKKGVYHVGLSEKAGE